MRPRLENSTKKIADKFEQIYMEILYSGTILDKLLEMKVCLTQSDQNIPIFIFVCSFTQVYIVN